eukprot:303241-Alexandrium_andersonii.AAC.1
MPLLPRGTEPGRRYSYLWSRAGGKCAGAPAEDRPLLPDQHQGGRRRPPPPVGQLHWRGHQRPHLRPGGASRPERSPLRERAPEPGRPWQPQERAPYL